MEIFKEQIDYDKKKELYNLINQIDPYQKRVGSNFDFLIDSYNNLYDFALKLNKSNPFMYDQNGLWWLWDNKNSCWDICDEIDILNIVKTASYLITWNSKTKNEVLNVLKQVGRKRQPKELPLEWIQLKNCVINLKTGDKFKAEPDYFYTHPIPHELGIDDNCDKFDSLFRDWVGDDHLQTLYEIIAYCLYPHYPIERIFCLLGSGSNGKSCYLNILRNFLGLKNVVSAKLHRIVESRFEISKLRNKLACLMGETNFRDIKDTDTLKSLVSGKDLMSIEYKNKNGFLEYVNYAKMIIATNNLPNTLDTSDGWGRKWLIIDFPNTFDETKKIMEEIKESDYERLLNRSISILMDLLKNMKFHNEGDIRFRCERYQAKANFLQQFLKDKTTHSPSNFITKKEFYDNFIDWSRQNGHRTLTMHSVAKELRSLGIEEDRKYFDWLNDGKGGQMRVWTGIKWN